MVQLQVLENDDKDPLCCCEYTNVHGERAHLCGLFCDCAELDDTFDRFISGKTLPHQRFEAILTVVEDRIRLPWPKGAKKVPFDLISPWIIVPSLFGMASFSWSSQVAVHGLVLPLLIFCKYQTCLRSYRPQTKFFAMWSLATFATLVYVYQYHVVGILYWPKTVSPWENLCLVGCVVGAIYSVYKVRSHEHNNGFASGKYCKICSLTIPGKDHHCVWIDACISQDNMKFFLAFLSCILLSLVQAGAIFLTSVCLPLTEVWWPYIIIPDRWCQRWNTHFEGNVHLTWTAGIHCLLLAVPIACLLTAKSASYFYKLVNNTKIV